MAKKAKRGNGKAHARLSLSNPRKRQRPRAAKRSKAEGATAKLPTWTPCANRSWMPTPA